MKPAISVIIPNFNRRQFIGRALDSVLSQTLPALEIIVVDDGSTDQSLEFIKNKYPSIRLLTQEHKGVSAARNLGIKLAKGAWIALLDSDDAWFKEKLSLQYKAVEQNKTYKVVHTNEIWMRNYSPLKQMKKHRKYGGHIYQHCLPLCAMSPSSIMIHQDVFDDIGFFDEDLPVCEDYDLWLRICSRYPVLFLEQALITKHGGHDDQLSQQYWGMDRYRIRALAKILNTTNLNPADHKATVEMMLNKIELFLKGAKKHGNNEFCHEFEKLQNNYISAPVTDLQN
jgi:glycosyltransferase involved in cell wall biosynthesis